MRAENSDIGLVEIDMTILKSPSAFILFLPAAHRTTAFFEWNHVGNLAIL